MNKQLEQIKRVLPKTEHDKELLRIKQQLNDKSRPQVVMFVYSFTSRYDSNGAYCVLMFSGNKVKKVSNNIENKNNYELSILAIIDALRYIQKGCNISIIIYNKYAYSSIKYYIHGWKQNDWYRKDGSNIKYRDLFMKLYDELFDNRNNHYVDIIRFSDSPDLLECKEECFKTCLALIKSKQVKIIKNNYKPKRNRPKYSKKKEIDKDKQYIKTAKHNNTLKGKIVPYDKVNK